MSITVAAYLVIQDNELLVEAAAPQQTFPVFDAPGEDGSSPAVLIFRMRPNTSFGDIRFNLTLNNHLIGSDNLFESVKRGWTETFSAGFLRSTGNELTVSLLSSDGSAAPEGSQVGISEVTLLRSVQLTC
jgi:hypothetical protein